MPKRAPREVSSNGGTYAGISISSKYKVSVGDQGHSETDTDQHLLEGQDDANYTASMV